MTPRALEALEALVAALEACPLWERPGHCAWFWENEAKLARLQRKERETDERESKKRRRVGK